MIKKLQFIFLFLAVTLISNAIYANNTAQYEMQFFNKTFNDPINIVVVNKGNKIVETKLPNDNNASMTILIAFEGDSDTSKVTLSDNNKKILWIGNVTYYVAKNEFYYETNYLAENYYMNSETLGEKKHITFTLKNLKQ